MIIIISAPSGAGKSTLIKRLFKKIAGLKFSISRTTRPPRKGEKDGREYFFVSESEFKKGIKKGEFAEWAKVHESYYGTPKSYVKKVIDSGYDVLLDIDVKGAMNLHKIYKAALLIFIKAPSFRELEKRIRFRNKDSESSIRTRLKNARKEMKFEGKYDYSVVNDRIPAAVKELATIITSERIKGRQ
jgi:guanylate kinase